MFEQAARSKLRFETPKGQLSVEDLWDLPLSSRNGANLDGIAVALHHQMKNDNISFVDTAEKPDPILQLRFDIVRHVITVRLEEKRRADEARVIAERKQKILGIIARKEDQVLENTSLDELRQLIGSL